MGSTPPPPGGHRTLQRRRAAQSAREKQAKQTPASTRQAGHGGSSNSVLALFTEELDGIKVDPLVVLFMAVGFVFSIISLHALYRSKQQ